MEYVLLPIFDENDIDTGKRLKINTRYFLGSAGSITAHRDIEVVMPSKVEEEIEMVDRIISGLPPKPHYSEPITFERKKEPGLWDFLYTNQPSAHFLVENGEVKQQIFPEDVEFRNGVHITDVSSKYPDFKEEDLDYNQAVFIPDLWRPIPGFSHYEMNLNKKIVTAKDGKSVSIMKGGRVDNVLLSDDNGNTKRMSVDWLFDQTFPKN